ncbi:hypothetical protein VTI74DRAFT_6458 [Chaetomium olivicolor]
MDTGDENANGGDAHGGMSDEGWNGGGDVRDGDGAGSGEGNRSEENDKDGDGRSGSEGDDDNGGDGHGQLGGGQSRDADDTDGADADDSGLLDSPQRGAVNEKVRNWLGTENQNQSSRDARDLAVDKPGAKTRTNESAVQSHMPSGEGTAASSRSNDVHTPSGEGTAASSEPDKSQFLPGELTAAPSDPEEPPERGRSREARRLFSAEPQLPPGKVTLPSSSSSPDPFQAAVTRLTAVPSGPTGQERARARNARLLAGVNPQVPSSKGKTTASSPSSSSSSEEEQEQEDEPLLQDDGLRRQGEQGEGEDGEEDDDQLQDEEEEDQGARQWKRRVYAVLGSLPLALVAALLTWFVAARVLRLRLPLPLPRVWVV